MIFLRARRRAVTLLGVTSVAAGFLLNASVATAARAATSTGGGSGSAGAPSFSVTGVNGPLPATLPTAGASSPYAVGAATALAPAAATAATAAASGDGKVAVAWVPGVAGGGLTADTWWIQTYQADGTYIGEQAAPATATSATVTGLVPGYGYLFGVLADSSGSYSAYRFSPTVTTSGYQGQPGTPLPIANPQARPASTGPPVNPVTTLTTKISLPLPVGGTPPTLPPVGTPSLPTSGAVLGKEAWQTYENTDAGRPPASTSPTATSSSPHRTAPRFRPTASSPTLCAAPTTASTRAPWRPHRAASAPAGASTSARSSATPPAPGSSAAR